MTSRQQWFTEAGHQTLLFQWAHLASNMRPELRLMFAVPNGGLRNEAVAAGLKRQGLKSGVPDIFLPIARGPWHGMFVELKSPAYPPLKKRAGVTSIEQEAWLEALHGEGYKCLVCYGWDEAREAIISYLDA